VGKGKALDFKAAELKFCAGLEGLEVDVGGAIVDGGGRLGSEVDRLFDFSGDAGEAAYVVGVFVGNEDGVDGLVGNVGSFETAKGFFAGEAAIDEDAGFAIAEVGRIAGAGGGENMKTQRRSQRSEASF
jgi:hypothetical protein